MTQSISLKAQAAFSKAAPGYDGYADLQKDIGLRLLNRLPKSMDKHTRILDVGMGTGWLTEKIVNFFSLSQIVGIDFAQGMARAAKNKKIDCVLQADALHLPFQSRVFDLVVSNCVYQWVPDLEIAFNGSHRVLKPDGFFIFSLFGCSTLKELRLCLGQQYHFKMPRREDVLQALKHSGFSEFKTRAFVIRKEFQDFWQLVRWLKTIGANGVVGQRLVGKDFLNRVSQDYQQRFSAPGGVYATFEVIEAWAQK